MLIAPRRRRGTRGRRAYARSRPCARRTDSSWMRVCVGSPGIFSTRKCRSARLAICGRCVIVITCARAARRASVSATPCAVVPADAGVDLVEDHRLAAADRGDRERDARELAAGGGLGDRRERQARVRAGSGRPPRRRRSAPGSRSPQLDPELAVAHADARAARPRPRPRTGPAAAARASWSAPASSATRASACASASAAAATGSSPSSSALELGPRLRRAGEQLLEGLAAEAPARIGDPVELALDLLEPAGIGLEHASGTSAARSPPRAGAARRRGARRRPSAAPARAARPARAQRSAAAVSPAAPSPSSGSSASAAAAAPSTSSVRCRSRSRSSRSASSCARLHALGVLDERAQLGEPRLGRGRVARELLVPLPRAPPARARRAAPRPAGAAAPRRRTSRAPTSWYVGRASRRCSNWPDIASSRSPSAATSSRAALRPHAYARVRPSDPIRRASTTPSSSSGPQVARAPRTPPPRAARPAGRTRPRRTRRRPRRRRTRRRPSRRAGARSPARGSSCPRRSRR